MSEYTQRGHCVCYELSVWIAKKIPTELFAKLEMLGVSFKKFEEMMLEKNIDRFFEFLANGASLPDSKDLDKVDDAPSSAKLDSQCPIKNKHKNQEKLSMFYAGYKRRKGGRYA